MSGALEIGLAVIAATGLAIIVTLVVVRAIIGDAARQALAALARLIGRRS